MPSLKDRAEITEASIAEALATVKDNLKRRIFEYGHGTFTSRHEILGILNEEMKELTDAVHDKASDNLEGIKAELSDIAVGAIFGIACCEQNTLHW